jgi:DNA/RNA-binding domain of Phe-tRNA-synthetase-like protein
VSAEAPSFSLGAEWEGKIRVGLLSMSPVRVQPTEGDLADEIESHAADLLRRFGGVAPAQIESLAAARQLYRAFSIDPTKTRPSSEKLLRRVLQGKPLPRISNAVDLCNLIALRLMLPIGLYDSARIAGGVVLRAGDAGEVYEGIAGQRVGLEGRPALADSQGAFGNPTADSARTAVREATKSLWMTVFAPADEPAERLQRSMEQARESFERHLLPEGRSAASHIALAGYPQ